MTYWKKGEDDLLGIGKWAIKDPTPGNQEIYKPVKGVKHDGGKARMDLIPPEVLTGMAEILGFGADKYGARNWEHGMDWGRVYAAMQRHLNAWWGGEELDPESGMSHLNHAIFGVMALMAYQKRQTGEDTRWKGK